MGFWDEEELGAVLVNPFGDEDAQEAASGSVLILIVSDGEDLTYFQPNFLALIVLDASSGLSA